jgi:branched-chain amino acid transport system substrate-binding protein
MTQVRKNKTALPLLAGVAAIFFSSFAHADVQVGLIAPLSGQYAAFGEQIRKGAEQAVKDINAAGGVKGQKIELVTADDACDPKQAVTAANQLVSKGVKYVVGHYCSGSAIPASKVFVDEKVVLISPGATNPQLTDQGGPTIFRVCGRDDRQGEIIAATILKDEKGKHIAILNDKSTYGRGLADEVKKGLNAGGVKEDMFETYTAGEKDYSALVSNLMKSNIDAIFIGGYHTEGGLIARQLRAAGSKAQIYAGDSFVTNEFWSITGPAGEGVRMTFGPDPRLNKEAATAVESIRKAGYEPEGYTLYSYAAVQIFAKALESGATPDVVAQDMHKETFKTVLGDLGFDAKGDIRQPAYVIYRWKDGKYAQE